MIKIYLSAVLLIMPFANNDKRIIKDVNIKLATEINLSEYELFLPQSLDIDSSGNVLFFDRGLSKVVLLKDGENNPVIFGDGKGRGPREFQRVWDLEIDNNQEIYLTDMDKQKIIKWNIHQEFKGEIEIGGRFIRPSRFALCKSGDVMYMLSSQYGPKGIIHKLTKEGELLNSIWKIDSHEERLPYYTDGEMACDENENLYYSGRFTNSIRKYDSKGEIIFDREVFDFEGNEKITVKDGMFTTLAADVKRATGEIHLIGNNLLVAYSGRKDGLLKNIDVYSTNDGTYKYSLEMPNHFESYTISHDRIVTFETRDSEDVMLCIYFYEGFNNSI